MSDSESDTPPDFGPDVDEAETSDDSISSDDSSAEYEDEPDDRSGGVEGDADSDIQIVGGIWASIIGDDEGPPDIPFTGNPGPKRVPAEVTDPIEYIQLFLSDQLVNLIVTETNRYANQWIQSHQEYLREKPKSRVHRWIKEGNTNASEIKAFLSILMNMGLIKKPTIESYFDVSNQSQRTPWFSEHFSLTRFRLLLKFLHFADNTKQPTTQDSASRLYKIQQFVDILTNLFLRYYEPYQNVAIDESMIGYRGKTPHLRQYMPQKHHAKFGVKLWCLCDSKGGYTSFFEIYRGAHTDEDAGAEGVTFNLVVRLLEKANLLYKGYHIGLDNYFSSPALFFDLFEKRTAATGTVRANRKGLSKEVLSAKLKNKELCERRKGPLLCVAYKDGTKRPVLISTKEKAGLVTERNAKGKYVTRPRCVSLYNKVMGGVDHSDARMYAFLAERRTMKWTTKVAFGLMGRALLNSFILYDLNTTTPTKKLNRNQFMVSGLEALMGDYRPAVLHKKRRTKTQIEADQATLPHIAPPTHEMQTGQSTCSLEKLPVGKRRNCAVPHPTRVRSSWQCPICDVGLCPPCFATYHSSKRKTY